MFDHDDIWRAIDTLAKEKGYSTSGLAKQAGLDPTTFNKSKRRTANGKLRWPSTESISKILFVTGTNTEEFTSYLTGKAAKTHRFTIPHIEEKKAKKQSILSDQKELLKTEMDSIVLLPIDKDRLLSFEITSNDFDPIYPPNTVLVVDLDEAPRKDDRVLIKTKKRQIVLGSLKRNTANCLYLNEDDQEIDQNDIEWFGRILWASQ